MNPLEKERLLDRFRDYLDRMDEDTHEEASPPEEVDLHVLLSEMAVLKNEVRIGARQYKNTLLELQKSSLFLVGQNERLARELEFAKSQINVAKRETEREILLELLDLRDRIEAGTRSGKDRKHSFLSRLVPFETQYAKSLEEGLALILNRLDLLLEFRRVRPINAVGQPFDPERMRVMEVRSVPGLANGMVVAEIRRGFLHDGSLLRLSDVVVNKTNTVEERG